MYERIDDPRFDRQPPIRKVKKQTVQHDNEVWWHPDLETYEGRFVPVRRPEGEGLLLECYNRGESYHDVGPLLCRAWPHTTLRLFLPDLEGARRRLEAQGRPVTREALIAHFAADEAEAAQTPFESAAERVWRFFRRLQQAT
jgi:hypothetical protein